MGAKLGREGMKSGGRKCVRVSLGKCRCSKREGQAKCVNNVVKNVWRVCVRVANLGAVGKCKNGGGKIPMGMNGMSHQSWWNNEKWRANPTQINLTTGTNNA